MFRKLLAMMLCVLLVLCVAGCDNNGEVETTHDHGAHATEPKNYPPLVMINGTLYMDNKIVAEGAQIDEAQIEGRITFTIKSTSKPSRDNEANYMKAHNAPYARWTDATYGEVYVIQYSGAWYILQPAKL